LFAIGGVRLVDGTDPKRPLARAVEIKLVHPADGRNTTLDEGLEQIARYDNGIGADTLHLVIFDRRPETRAKPWEERLARETRATAAGKPVAVVWC
jgi:hypothetical protein